MITTTTIPENALQKRLKELVHVIEHHVNATTRIKEMLSPSDPLLRHLYGPVLEIGYDDITSQIELPCKCRFTLDAPNSHTTGHLPDEVFHFEEFINLQHVDTEVLISYKPVLDRLLKYHLDGNYDIMLNFKSGRLYFLFLDIPHHMTSVVYRKSTRTFTYKHFFLGKFNTPIRECDHQTYVKELLDIGLPMSLTDAVKSVKALAAKDIYLKYKEEFFHPLTLAGQYMAELSFHEFTHELLFLQSFENNFICTITTKLVEAVKSTYPLEELTFDYFYEVYRWLINMSSNCNFIKPCDAVNGNLSVVLKTALDIPMFLINDIVQRVNTRRQHSDEGISNEPHTDEVQFDPSIEHEASSFDSNEYLEGNSEERAHLFPQSGTNSSPALRRTVGTSELRVKKEIEKKFHAFVEKLEEKKKQNSIRAQRDLKQTYYFSHIARPEMGMLNGTVDTSPEMKEILKTFNTNSDRIIDIIEGFFTSANNRAGKINEKLHIDDMFKDGKPQNMKREILSAITDAMKTHMVETVGTHLWEHRIGYLVLLILATSYDYSINHRQTSLIACLAMSALLGYIMGKKAILVVMPIIGEMLYKFEHETDGSMEPQFCAEDLDVTLTGCTTLINCYLASFSKDFTEIPKSFLKGLGTFDRTKKSLGSIIEMFIKIIEKCTNYVRTELLSTKPIRFIEHNIQGVDAFIKECDAINNDLAQKKFQMNPENYLRLKLAIQGGRNLQSTFDRSAPPGLSAAVNAEIFNLNKIRSSFVASNYGFEGIKQEAVGTLFRGGPGTGKSHSLHYFFHILAQHILSEEDMKEYVADPGAFLHNRQIENIFWDGYTERCMFTMYDDFAQFVDSVGGPTSDFMEVIRAINSYPMHLHMSSIAQKANVTFQSKFVFATTNCSSFDVKSIVSEEAVWRRFDFTYDVCPKQEFCTEETKCLDIFSRRLDHSKLPKGCFEVADLHPRYLEFHRFSHSTDKAKGVIYSDTLNFYQVVQELLERYHIKSKWYKQTLSQLKTEIIKVEVVETPVVDLDMEAVPQAGPPRLSRNMRAKGTFFDEPEPPKAFNLYPKSIQEWMKWLVEDPEAELVRKSIRQTTMNVKTYLLKHRQLHSIVTMDDYSVVALLLYNNPEFEYYFLGMKADESFIRYLPDKIQYPSILVKGGLDYFKKKVEKWKQEAKTFLATTAFPKLLQAIAHLQTFWKEYAIVISVIFGIAGSCVVIKNVINLTKRWYPDAENHYFGYYQESFSSRGAGKKHTQKTTKQMLLNRPSVMQPQSAASYDPAGWRMMESVIKRNCYSLTYVTTDDKPVMMGYLTMLKDTVGIVPFHFITCMLAIIETDKKSKDGALVITNGKSHLNYQYKITFEEFISCAGYSEHLREQDLILVKLPRTFRPSANIIEFFPTLDDLTKIKTTKCSLVFPHFKGMQSQILDVEPHENQLVKGEGDMYSIRNGYTYISQTEPGDCGALLILLNKCVPKRKIIGMHVAGSRKETTGYAAGLTQCAILAAIDEGFPGEVLTEIPLEPQAGLQNLPAIGGDLQRLKISFDNLAFNYLYTTNQINMRNTKSRVICSRLVDAWGEREENPAQLKCFTDSNQVFRDPLVEAISRYGKPKKDNDPAIVDIVQDSYYCFLNRKSKITVLPRIFTYEEAIFGLSADPDFKPIDRTTSLGYPLSLKALKEGKPGKTLILGSGQDFDIEHEEAYKFKQTVFRHISKLELCERPHFIYADKAKDERIAKAKTPVWNDNFDPSKLKTRPFGGAPFDLTILFRMYYGSFMLWYVKNRVLNGSAIGCNPYADWDSIAKELLRHGYADESAFGSGDYKGFDTSLTVTVLWAIYNIIEEWYGSCSIRERSVRKTLWLEIVNSIHIVDDTVYSWNGGNPSGNAMTAIINSMYNHMAFRLSWLHIMDYNYNMLPLFDEHVYLIVLGDDNNFSVSYPFRQVFNEITIADAMEHIGLTYTTELKEKALIPLRKLTDIDFLKRSYRKCPIHQRYEAPLRLKTTLEIPYWTKDNNECDIIMHSNLVDCQRELALHPKETYEYWMEKIVSAIKERKLNFPFSTTKYEQIHDLAQEHLTFY